MLQSALVESFQESGRLRSVQGDAGRFPATHTLVIEVRRFEADYTAGGVPVAEVALPRPWGAIPTGRCWRRSPPPRARTRRRTARHRVVAALDAAFGRAASELATRSFETIAADLASAERARSGGG